MYECVGFSSDDVVPSPKSHRKLVAPPDEVLVKRNKLLSGHADVIFELKSAVGLPSTVIKFV